MASTQAPTYRRATEFVKGIGESLDTIQGRDVLLHAFKVSERPMRGESKTFVAMTISELEAPEVVSEYHAWSESIGDKLQEIPVNAFPLLVKFVKVATAGGFRVWSFE